MGVGGIIKPKERKRGRVQGRYGEMRGICVLFA